MADYQKMYAVLCGAIDNVLDGLRTIPLAQPYARQLYSALLSTSTPRFTPRIRNRRRSYS